MCVEVYNGMGEIIQSGIGTIVSQMSTGNPKWDSVTVKFEDGQKVSGYLLKEKATIS